MVEPIRRGPDDADRPADSRPWWQRLFGSGPADPPRSVPADEAGATAEPPDASDDGADILTVDAPVAPSGLAAAAQARGWSIEEQSAELERLLEVAPYRLGAGYTVFPVTCGRDGSRELLAGEVRFRQRGELGPPLYAVTALPLLQPLPVLRVSPTRFFAPRRTGLSPLTTGDAEFDRRWRVLADVSGGAEHLMTLLDEPLRARLLGTPDLDELWAADGYLVVSRADGHHPVLLDEHVALLAAAHEALTAS